MSLLPAAAADGSVPDLSAPDDRLRHTLVPPFEAMLECALALVDEWRPGRSLSVLDLGAGTGLFSAMLLERYPGARVHLVEGSDTMLATARQRLVGHDAVTFAQEDPVNATLDGNWDLVVSALSIHHLDDGARKDLLERIRHALAPGSLFVAAEQVRGPTPAAEARYARAWLQAVHTAGVEQAAVAEAQGHPRPLATVDDQLAWMRDAGFSDVDCSFKWWGFAVVSGRA